jgi:putative membrane protein insertion efficiency factor
VASTIRLWREALVLPLRAYRLLLSPLLPPSCRFAPSCSAYAVQAILAHGLGCGGRLAVMRVLRCHPWGAGGYDPVPRKLEPHPHGRAYLHAVPRSEA